jgi:hypothetical protein
MLNPIVTGSPDGASARAATPGASIIASTAAATAILLGILPPRCEQLASLENVMPGLDPGIYKRPARAGLSMDCRVKPDND